MTNITQKSEHLGQILLQNICHVKWFAAVRARIQFKISIKIARLISYITARPIQGLFNIKSVLAGLFSCTRLFEIYLPKISDDCSKVI